MIHTRTYELPHQTVLLTAEFNPEDNIRARYDLDIVGHYARPDVFSLSVDERPRLGSSFLKAGTIIE